MQREVNGNSFGKIFKHYFVIKHKIGVDLWIDVSKRFMFGHKSSLS